MKNITVHLSKAALAGILATVMAVSAQAASIKVGTTSGPHAEVLEVVKEEAAKRGLDITIIEFNDYVIPNEALVSGEIDANTFQTRPFLDNYVKSSGKTVVDVAKTYVLPLGYYSTKYKSFDELPEGAQVGISNDPTNAARALLLLSHKGVIKLRDGGHDNSTVLDIVENPRNFEFIELEAGQLARSLADVDVAAINTSFAIKANLDPAKDAILREDRDSPYSNIIAVGEKNVKAPWLADFISAFHSDPVKEALAVQLKGAAVPAW